MFDKPVNWDVIVEESVKALNAVGLDFGAVDLRCQSAKYSKGRTREDPDFIVVEINSAPSFGELTLQKYIEELPKILIRKANG
jgi:glutathione synthase/RimK-type ligase-like ATP-grasp enzyme